MTAVREDAAMTDNNAPVCADTRTEISIGSPCDWDKAPDPCGVVIFGASGDLTLRKLVPSLYNLYRHGGLPNCFYILGAARTDLTDEAFRDKMRQGILTSGFEMDGWEDFSRRLHYQTIYYDRPESFADLALKAESLDFLHQTGGSRIYNLAIPPNLYREVVERMGAAGLCREYPERGVWSRLVIEKPFGIDLASAQRLNQSIGRSFREHQVFRIDHYLAKDTVQNILILRFANTIFEPLWNRNYIDHVRINASESLGVEHRAGYYEQAGVLRDMFQNHMMQLLALVASEPPSKFSADRCGTPRPRFSVLSVHCPSTAWTIT